MPLSTIIVEDEPLSREFLCNLLTEFCPEVQILSTSATENGAIEIITKLNPDLVFLDIQLQVGTGFNVLKNIGHTNFQVIFTTGLDDDAIKTIKISGVEYLQKPVDIEGLKRAIKIVSEKLNTKVAQAALTSLVETLKNDNNPIKLMLQTAEEVEFVIIKDIIRIEANESNCTFILKSGAKKIVAKNLKEYETLLSDYHFFRTHNYHVINTKEIIKIKNAENATIKMSDGSTIPLSAKKKEELTSIVQEA